MKLCPQCNRVETEDTLTFCRVDGTPLVRESGAASGGAGTLRFGSAPATGDTETRILPTGEALDRPTARTTVLESRAASGDTRGLYRPKSHRGFVTALVAVLALAVAASGYFYLSRGGGAKNSVAVLPFENASGDQSMEYLSDGISENIINSLSQLSNVRVVARTTMFTFKGKDADPRAVGKQLGVDAVLTGKVVQRGDTLSIQADLLNVSDGSQTWGEQYNRELTDLVALQGEIARDVSNKLRVKLSGADERALAKTYTENAEAYQLYLKGRFYWNKRTEEGIRKGIEFFQQAADKDPNFALAYVGVSDSYLLLGIPDAMTGTLPPQESLPKARAAAERALEIDDSLSEAYASRAHVKWKERDWAGSEVDFKRSVELNPNYANARLFYGLYLSNLGRHEEALKELRRAQEIDPLSLPINASVGFALFYARRYDEAVEQGKKAVEMDAGFALGHQRLGMAYALKGMYGEAIAESRQAMNYSKGAPLATVSLGYAYAVAGNRREAEKVLSELTDFSARRYVSPYGVALMYVGLGEREQAFQWLEKAHEERNVELIWIKVDPRLDPLRPDPRFADLMRRVGLPQ